MSVTNEHIAYLFRRLADLLELDGENPFAIRAYRNAAESVEGHAHQMADLVKAGEDLTAIPGIGKDLAAKIKELLETGEFQKLHEAEERVPPELLDVLRVPGLGAKRTITLYKELGVRNLEDLRQAADGGKIAGLSGFGKKTQEKILAALDSVDTSDHRFPLVVAERHADTLVEFLKDAPGVEQVTTAGSFRRRKETVGDLDILVSAEDGTAVMDRFVTHPDVREVVSKGETRSTVMLFNGLQVDLRVVPKESYGAALHYFTGSKEHNVAVRTRGVKMGLKINEYGVYKDDEHIAGATEEEVYKAVGLTYVEPELRENRGEIEAAEKGELPVLVQIGDIKGDLHTHSTATDGRNSILEMAAAAKKAGLKYMAVTDHTKRLAMVGGLDEKRLAEQIEEINRLNEELDDFVILKGSEVDILDDGRLDLDDGILRELDVCICSIHQGFHLSREKQTARVLKAMDNPHFNILAHPTGRLLGDRAPYEIDLEQIMRAAVERGCFLEASARPERLDLNGPHCRAAKEMGLKVVINTDSHGIEGFANLRYGVEQARRGGLTVEDVLNTHALEDLRVFLRRS